MDVAARQDLAEEEGNANELLENALKISEPLELPGWDNAASRAFAKEGTDVSHTRPLASAQGYEIITSRADHARMTDKPTARHDDSSSLRRTFSAGVPAIAVLPEPDASEDEDDDYERQDRRRPSKRMRVQDEDEDEGVVEEDELMDELTHDSGVAFLSDDGLGVHHRDNAYPATKGGDSQLSPHDDGEANPFLLQPQQTQDRDYDLPVDVETFRPLLFESQIEPHMQTPVHTPQKQLPYQELYSQSSREHPAPMPNSPPSHSAAEDAQLEQLQHFAHDRALGIDVFAQLRGRKIARPLTPTMIVASTVSDEPFAPPPPDEQEQRSVPQGFFDRNTLQLSSIDSLPPTSNHSVQHRYLSSIDFIQKQPIIRHLRSLQVDLVERDTLSGVHLMYDCSSAAICTNLCTLPADIENVTKLLCQQSYHFSSILIVFEAYPPTLSFRAPPTNKASLTTSSTNLEDFWAYSPPVIKAVRKLRRDLSVAEGLNEKHQGCLVKMAFGANPEEVARYLRMGGDQVDDGGVLWDARNWLDDELPVSVFVCLSRSVGPTLENDAYRTSWIWLRLLA